MAVTIGGVERTMTAGVSYDVADVTGTFPNLLCLGFAVCGLRFAVCGLRSVVFRLRFAVCDLRFAVCGLRSAVFGFRFSVFDFRFSICGLKCGVWCLVFRGQGSEIPTGLSEARGPSQPEMTPSSKCPEPESET